MKMRTCEIKGGKLLIDPSKIAYILAQGDVVEIYFTGVSEPLKMSMETFLKLKTTLE